MLVMQLVMQLASDVWSQLPNCSVEDCPVAIINGWLTTLGEYAHSNYSNELFSLTGKGRGRRWTKKFPPMPTKGCMMTVFRTAGGSTLTVAGGM